MTPGKTTGGTDLLALLQSAKVIPVLTIERREDAVPLARALVEGGLPVLEVTLRTAAAIDAATAIISEVPEAIVGIGTLLEPKDLERAKAAGARFAVSPGSTPNLLAAAADGDLPLLPGAVTPSEMMLARAHGFRLLKFSPAEAFGGIAALKAHAGPLADLRFCPTGGIGDENFRAYLGLSNVVAVGGSWLAPAAEIAAGAWTEISARARRVAAAAGSIRPSDGS